MRCLRKKLPASAYPQSGNPACSPQLSIEAKTATSTYAEDTNIEGSKQFSVSSLFRLCSGLHVLSFDHLNSLRRSEVEEISFHWDVFPNVLEDELSR